MGRFHDRFAEGRVGVHVAGDLFRRDVHPLCQGQFRQQFGHLGADHVGAEQLAALRIAEQLDESGGFIQPQGFAVGPEGELARLDLVAAFLGLRFGKAEGGHLRMAIGRSRHHLIVQGDRLDPGDVLRADDPLGGGDMSEHQLGGHVADRPDALDVRSHALVDLDRAAVVQCDADIFQAESLAVGFEADRQQGLIRLEGLLAAFAADLDFDAIVRGLDRFHPGVGHHLDSFALEGGEQLFAHFFVFEGDDVRQHLDDGDIDAVGVPDGGKLDADGAGADDDDGVGQVFLQDRLGVGDHLLAVDFHAGNHDRVRAGGHNDVVGAQSIGLPLFVGDFDGVGGDQLGLAHVDVDLVVLQQVADPLGQPLGDLAAALDRLGVIQFQVVEGEAKGAAAVMQQFGDVGVFEQRFGGDATHVQADAPDPLFFDHGGFQSQLGGADGGDIPARPGANHNDIIVAHINSF